MWPGEGKPCQEVEIKQTFKPQKEDICVAMPNRSILCTSEQQKGRSLRSKKERIYNEYANKNPCQEHCNSDPVVLKQEETLMSKRQKEPQCLEILTMHGF